MGRPRTNPDKECPVCNATHRNRGLYCSKVCSNKGRLVTDEQKQKTSESMTKFMNSDDDVAEEARWRINNFTKETEPVIPGRIPDERYFNDGKDIWFDAD